MYYLNYITSLHDYYSALPYKDVLSMPFEDKQIINEFLFYFLVQIWKKQYMRLFPHVWTIAMLCTLDLMKGPAESPKFCSLLTKTKKPEHITPVPRTLH